jgi:hypothetical protein
MINKIKEITDIYLDSIIGGFLTSSLVFASAIVNDMRIGFEINPLMSTEIILGSGLSVSFMILIINLIIENKNKNSLIQSLEGKIKIMGNIINSNFNEENIEKL